MPKNIIGKIGSHEDFAGFIAEIESKEWYRKPIGFGIARVNKGQINPEKILQATFPVVNWNEEKSSAALFIAALKATSDEEIDFSKSSITSKINNDFIEYCLNALNPFVSEAKANDHKNTQVLTLINSLGNNPELSIKDFRLVFIFEDVAPETTEEVYLKLYAISTGKAKIRSLNLNGAFGKLHNCAWVRNKPFELDYLRNKEVELKTLGKYPNIDFVDKFPRFLQHIIPADNTRILETSKVRFGAQLAAGTTVMPGAAYINFNAGTLGSVMVEGRISSSAIVGAGSDVGGGASILGVLSGTDGVPVTIGENTLLEANSCTGTSIGDGCIIDAGVTILPGTKITLSEKAIAELKLINPGKSIRDLMKGSDFQDINGVHFRVDSQNGKTIAQRSTREVKLNSDLH